MCSSLVSLVRSSNLCVESTRLSNIEIESARGGVAGEDRGVSAY